MATLDIAYAGATQRACSCWFRIGPVNQVRANSAVMLEPGLQSRLGSFPFCQYQWSYVQRPHQLCATQPLRRRSSIKTSDPTNRSPTLSTFSQQSAALSQLNKHQPATIHTRHNGTIVQSRRALFSTDSPGPHFPRIFAIRSFRSLAFLRIIYSAFCAISHIIRVSISFFLSS